MTTLSLSIALSLVVILYILYVLKKEHKELDSLNYKNIVICLIPYFNVYYCLAFVGVNLFCKWFFTK